MDLEFTAHARDRQRNRSIGVDIIKHVVAFGRERHHGGALVMEMDRRSREKLRRYLGADSYREIEDRLGIYVVMSQSGDIVTVAHRTRTSRDKATTRRSRARSRRFCFGSLVSERQAA